ncbi:substrate-binding domain-containing protein [Cesiribacter sp. SM1]|uniref:substrate-binding domain-containing protein n=1 Tax=Cesiribacter sp. SM1 TaxID=2861196 RepID=UPI001CD19739|nr:substrate-binding domain-containing protein [Cesiribacter sp. SM1]
MGQKKNRIKDIAFHAGVSVGTVDRVLHNRGRVSEEALKKVQEAIIKVDYKPNLIARTLGSRKRHYIAAIIPDPSLDEYWTQSSLGIKQSIAEWAPYDFQIDTYHFNLYDKNSFKSISEEVYLTKPDGILLAPIFYKETLPFLMLCKTAGIPYVLFNSNIPEASSLSFIGQNLLESGKVGGELCHIGHHGPGTFAILHINENIQNAVHLLEKEKGFRKFFEENQSGGVQVVSLDLESSEAAKINQEIELLVADPQLKGILVTTSKGLSIVSAFLERNGKKGIRLVGYDLLEENIRYLKAGIIDFLINQNPKRQAFLGIHHLSNYLLLKKEPPAMDLFPLEIITPQNLDSYLNARLHSY